MEQPERRREARKAKQHVEASKTQLTAGGHSKTQSNWSFLKKTKLLHLTPFGCTWEYRQYNLLVIENVDCGILLGSRSGQDVFHFHPHN
jgi:hypothetical protein